MLICFSTAAFSEVSLDSLVLTRMFNYQQNYVPNDTSSFSTNLYTKFNYNCWRRNFTLWLVPTMYSIADGERLFLAEYYGKLNYNADGSFTTNRQVVFSTIRHNRRAMPTLKEFLTPRLYDKLLYKDHLLSPFHYSNRMCYRYAVVPSADNMAIVTYRPRFGDNTQLCSGVATVDMNTGRILWARFNGEYDMIRFNTEMTQGEEGVRSLFPIRCRTNAEFKFLGNRILTTFEGVYDCPVTLPDSLDDVDSRELVDSLRPIPLLPEEEQVYKLYDEAHAPEPIDTVAVDTVAADTLQMAEEDGGHKIDFLNDILRRGIADHLVLSHRFSSEHSYMKLSPILNPQYLSYSRHRGTSYKLKMGFEYYFNDHRFFEFDPWCGYNFKFRKFYFTLPLRFTYNPKRDGYVQVVYGNGNRTSHGSVIDEIQREHGDSLDLSDQDLDLFDDYHVDISNNIMLFDWLDIETGLSMHRRRAYNPDLMDFYNKPREYRSFAPSLCFKIRPWRNGPLLTVDYERGIDGVNRSQIDYERWETDCSMKYLFSKIRKLNIRVGYGLYTQRGDNYFVDFSNFRDNNLPEGWDDDWTGNFQLLDSRWYNESRYYARMNLSYESPLIFCSWLPIVGRFLETERFYVSALSIDNTRPYSEVGYGFTTRLFSVGLFASFLHQHFQEFECKFTFELFRRW